MVTNASTQPTIATVAESPLRLVERAVHQRRELEENKRKWFDGAETIKKIKDTKAWLSELNPETDKRYEDNHIDWRTFINNSFERSYETIQAQIKIIENFSSVISRDVLAGAEWTKARYIPGDLAPDQIKYLFEFAASHSVKELKREAEEIRKESRSEPSSRALVEDIKTIETDSTIPDETTRDRLVATRLGQGAFRRSLLNRWDCRCAVFGHFIPDILRASHMKPWRDSTHEERLTPANGLLLCANLDALFDVHLISFEDNGAMLVSPSLSEDERRALGIPQSLREALTAEERRFLAVHRETFHKRLAKRKSNKQ